MHRFKSIGNPSVELVWPFRLAEVRVDHKPFVLARPKHAAKPTNALLALELVRLTSNIVQDDNVGLRDFTLSVLESFLPIALTKPGPINKHRLGRVVPLPVVPKVDRIGLDESHDSLSRVALTRAGASANHKLLPFAAVIERGVFDEPFSGLRQPDDQRVV